MLAALAGACAVSAQAADRPRFELTPFAGYRMGGDFDLDDPPEGMSDSAELDNSASWGVDLGIYRDRNSFYEILYSHQSAGVSTGDPALDGKDVTIQYLQVGGTLLFPHEHYVPWLSLTVGATQFSASGSYGSETEFSGSLGGGVRFPLGDHFAATIGVRGYVTAVDSDTSFICASGGNGGACLFKTTGSAFFQGEALLGFTAVF
jgi:hypothetical protein